MALIGSYATFGPIWRKAKAQTTKEKLSVIFRSIDCHTPIPTRSISWIGSISPCD